jgi:hypothetical protein
VNSFIRRAILCLALAFATYCAWEGYATYAAQREIRIVQTALGAALRHGSTMQEVTAELDKLSFRHTRVTSRAIIALKPYVSGTPIVSRGIQLSFHFDAKQRLLGWDSRIVAFGI